MNKVIPAKADMKGAVTVPLPLLLLPGTACDERLFAPMLERLGVPVAIVADMRGAGTSAELAARILDEAPEQFSLLGFSLGGIVASTSVKMAGDKFDESIIKYMRKVHKLYIGERTAEDLKLTIGTAYPREETISRECRGRDLVTGLPKSVEITSDEMMEALEEPLFTICEAVHNVLERTPPELAADISNSGIIVTGGGALMYGIDKRIQERTGIKVIIAEDPKSCVAIGTGKSLDILDKLESNALNRRAPYL